MFTRVVAKKEASISVIAADEGIRLEKGRAVYYLVGPKVESISDKKRLVLYVNGDELVDEEARGQMGWTGGVQKVSSSDVDGDLFVQSTSHNRKIKAGAAVLFISEGGSGMKKAKREGKEFPLWHVMPHSQPVLWPDELWLLMLDYACGEMPTDDAQKAYEWCQNSILILLSMISSCRRLYNIGSRSILWKSISHGFLLSTSWSDVASLSSIVSPYQGIYNSLIALVSSFVTFHSFQDVHCLNWKQSSLVRYQKHILGPEESEFEEGHDSHLVSGPLFVGPSNAIGVFQSRYSSFDDFDSPPPFKNAEKCLLSFSGFNRLKNHFFFYSAL